MHRYLKNIDIKEFLLTFGCLVICNLETIVQNKLIINFFNVDEYGKWVLLLSIYSFISMLPFSAIDQGIIRIVSKYRNNIYSFVKYIIKLYMLFFIPYICIYLLSFYFEFNIEILSEHIIFFAFYTITEITKTTFIAINNSLRLRKENLMVRLCEIIFKILLLLIVNRYYKIDISIVLLIFVIINTFIILFLFNEYYKTSNSQYSIRFEKKETFDSLMKYSLPLIIWACFGWLQNMINKWYIEIYLDYESVAIYSVLVSLSYTVPYMLYTIIDNYISPIVFEKNKEIDKRNLCNYLFFISLLFSIYIIFINIFGKEIILIFTNSNYLIVNKYLLITSISSCIYVLALSSTIEILRRKETKKLLIPNIIPGMFILICSPFLIESKGLIGAIISYVVAQVIYSLFTFTIVFKKSNINE